MKELKLPNGERFFILDKLTALYCYREIFEEQQYIPIDISLPANPTIIDVGANIGLFSYYAHQRFPNTNMISIEPIPQIFSVLEQNIEKFAINSKAYNIGLGEREMDLKFNFYPKISADSTAVPFDWEVKIQQYLENYQNVVCKRQPLAKLVPKILRKKAIEGRLRNLYQPEKVECQIRTLSSLIEENQLTQIDFLKIDAENYELHVIKGIKDQDWQKIQHIAMEVHTHISGGENLLDEIKTILKKHHFSFEFSSNDEGVKMGVPMLYAHRFPD